jgi:ribose transport system substrate-binding protein
VKRRYTHRGHGLRRYVALVVAVGAVALMAAGCGSSSKGSSASSSGTTGNSTAGTSSGAKSGKKLLIDFANGQEGASSYIDMQNTLVSALKLDPSVTLHTFNNNYSSSTTFENLSAMIAEHPDVIIEYNPLASASARVSQELKQSHIPCIAPNVPIAGCSFFNENLPPMGQKLAVQMAAKMKARKWTGANTEVVLVEIGSVGSLNSALWDFYGPLTHMVPGMKPVATSSMTTASSKIGSDGLQVNPDYSQSAGYSEFASLLQTIPKSKHLVVDCLGDDTCLGAYHAIAAAGRLNDAMLAAWGAGPQAMSLIRSGHTWVAESANFFANWGEFLAAMAVAVGDGAKPPAQTYPPMAIVTQSNFAHMFNAKGDAIHFPALSSTDNYLKSSSILKQLNNVDGIN